MEAVIVIYLATTHRCIGSSATDVVAQMVERRGPHGGTGTVGARFQRLLMDSELQKAIKQYDDSDRPPIGTHQWNLILDAARKVANLDYEAAVEVIGQLRFAKTADDWDDQIYEITEKAVNIALGITENTG